MHTEKKSPHPTPHPRTNRSKRKHRTGLLLKHGFLPCLVLGLQRWGLGLAKVCVSQKDTACRILHWQRKSQLVRSRFFQPGSFNQLVGSPGSWLNSLSSKTNARTSAHGMSLSHPSFPMRSQLSRSSIFWVSGANTLFRDTEDEIYADNTQYIIHLTLQVMSHQFGLQGSSPELERDSQCCITEHLWAVLEWVFHQINLSFCRLNFNWMFSGIRQGSEIIGVRI